MKALKFKGGRMICNAIKRFVFIFIFGLFSVFTYGVVPVISSVTPPSNGTYKVGDDIDITVLFDQVVNITNSPLIQITLNSGTVNALYNSGTGSTTVVFRYTVQSANSDNNGVSIVSPIQLNGGTIQNAALEDATLTFTAPDASGVLVDGVAPSGYSVSIDQTQISNLNKTAFSFTFSVAEVGATYNYSISSSGGGTDVTGSGTIATSTDQITGIDVSGLGDGTLTLTVSLTDAFGNIGADVTDNVSKDATAPGSYSVTVDQAYINSLNSSSLSFTFANAEVGATYSFSISSSGGGTAVNGSGTIATLTDQITGIDVSGLSDGTLTLTVNLTDTYSNVGVDVTDNVSKDATVPGSYSVTLDQAYINSLNSSSLSFTFANAEVGATYSYSIASSGGGTDVTSSGIIATSTDKIMGIDVSGLNDGTLTLTVNLTDTYSNVGADVTDDVSMETVVPSGYTVAIDQTEINSTNSTNFSFTFANAELGATYNYTISSSGGGADVTGSGTISDVAEQITGINLSSISDGNLTLSVTLTDTHGNVGISATDNVDKDATAPIGYSVSIDQTSINNSNKLAFSFRFSGAEVGSTYNYVINSDGGGTNVVASGTIATPTDQISGIDVSGLGDGTLTLSVTLTDTHGNIGVAVTDNVVKDVDAPTGYGITIDQSYINNSNKTSLSFTFSGAEVGATYNYSITSSGGGSAVENSGTISTATDIISGINVSGLGDGTLTLSVTLTDTYGNTGSAVSDLVDKDVVAPAKPSTPDLIDASDYGSSNSDNITNDNTPTLTGTAEAGSTVRLYEGLTEVGSGIATTGSWTITSSVLTEGSKSFTVKATDIAGNEGIISDALTVELDLTRPEPVISTTSPDTTNVKPIPFTVTFSESVTGFSVGDITFVATDLSKQNFTEVSPTEYTFELDGDDAFETNITVDINANVCQDIAGNTNTAATQYAMRFDWDRPAILSITSTEPNPTNASTINNIVIQFDEDVYHFSSTDLQLSNCTVVDFDQATGNRSKYYVDISPITDGELTIMVPENVCKDANTGGNFNYASIVFSIFSDRTKPTPTISSSVVGPVNSEFTVNIVFDEDVTGFGIADIILTNATKGTFTEIDAKNYTLVVIPSATGTVSVDISTNKCVDLADNSNNAAVTYSILCDLDPPTLSAVGIQSNNSNNTAYAKVGDIVTVSFTSSEEIKNVSALINGISATSVLNTGVNTWTVARAMLVTDTEGDISFTISFEDIAGNAATHSTGVTDGSSVLFYKTPPVLSTVSIISDYAVHTNRSKVGSVLTLSFSSLKELSGVTVSISGHSVVASSANGKDWSASYTLQLSDNEGTVPFTIDFSDIPGNSGARVTAITTGSNVVFDKTNPVLNVASIYSNNSNSEWVGVGGAVTVTLVSSENIEITSASIEGNVIVPVGSANNWTLTYTMQAGDSDGLVDFTVNYNDLSGNSNSTSVTTDGSSVTFDKVAPVLSTVLISSDNANSSARAKNGDLVKLQFIADDSIVNVIAKFNTKNAIVTPKGLNVWEAEFPISSSISDGKINFNISYKDLAGNNSETTSSTDGSKVIVDNTLPAFATVNISSNNPNPELAIAGNIITISIETSENIKTPVVSINNIAATTITGSLKNWTATRTINSGEPQGLIPFSISIQDSTGNSPAVRYTVTDASKVTFDDSSPLISSITVPSGTYRVGSIIPVTLITDGNAYIGTTVEVNGKVQVLINNGNNTYTVNYTVQENDIERNSVATLPVNIVLTDAAGLSSSKLFANVSSGTLTIDSKTPRIDSFSSNAEAVGIVRIGQEIVFTLKTVLAEPGLVITPTTYNGKALSWTTTDGGSTYTSKYTVAEGDPEQIVPLQLGNITLSDLAGNNDVKLLADYNPIQKQIFTTKPTIQITGSKVKCFDDVNEDVTFNFTGVQPFKLWYTHNGSKFFIDDITSSTYTIQIKDGTVSLDSLLDATTNRIYSAPSNVTITVNPLPVVTLDITGSPYSPDSEKDELNKYVQPVDKRSGVFSGEGVGYLSGKYYFYPSIIPEESKDKNLEIVYSFTDALGCIGRDTSIAFVSSTPVNIPDLKAGYCNYSNPVTVNGVLPAGHTGVFELFDSNNIPLASGWLQIDSVTLQINPQELPVGTYRVNYQALKYPSLELTSYINKTFTVEAKKTGISITGIYNEYCFNNQGSDVEFTVSGISFETGDKGHFSGAPVFTITPNAHTAKFKYSTALAEQDYNISYIYESVNGCLSDPVSETIHINPLPELVFALNDNYNFDQATIPLVGNHTSSSYLFSGEGVSRDTLFTSAARVGSPIIITYSYTDEKGCSNQTQRTTTIYKATETINNLSAIYCYEDMYIDISCTPNISDTITGTFISRRNALESTGKNTARYFLSRVGNGVDTVLFNYKIKGTDYSVFKEVLVDSIGQVQIISNLESYDFCKSIEKVQFSGVQVHSYGGQGNFSYSGNLSALLNRGSSAELYPTLENPGVYLVTYTYTSKSGCNSIDTKNLNIYSVPNANFNILASCPGIVDSVGFVNTSSPSDETMQWTWRIEGLEFYNKNLKYKFQSIGSKSVTLVAKSSNGCQSLKDTIINVGISPKADFDWSHDCNIGSPIIFTDKSTNATSPTYTWKLNGTTSLGSGSTIQHSFSEIGVYDIKLSINTLDGCTDSITKRLMLQPYIKIVDLANSHYLENFDNANPYYNWEAKGISMSDSCRWNLGTPNGSLINYTASGSNSWYTRITDKANIENSQVISPCFDLSGLKNPMIKLNIWSSSEYKRDGAVLQFSTDQGKTWTNLGSKGEGIGWFDSENIQSQPGGEKQFYGWNENPMNEWNTARHSLDNLIGRTNVRFRIAYAADGGGVSKVDGFAFDDVWIGDRTQNVVYEYFVNTNLADAQSYYPQTRELEEDLIEDIIPIHYHTSYPSGDPLNQFYTSGPSSRVFFYGVSQIPYARANGNSYFDFPSGLNALAYFKAISDSINIKSLSDPKVDIGISAVKNANTCNIAINLKNNLDLTGKMLGLQCAAVKNSINVSGKVYHNILRSFIPDASGTAIAGNLSAGESQVINLSWTPSNSDEFANAKIIAFVQDLTTKEIYQAATYDLSLITDIDPVDIGELVSVFPNPVSDLLYVVSEVDLNEIQIFDISGRLVRNYSKLSRNICLPVNDLVGGVYLLKGNTLKGSFVKKFVKQ